MILIQPCTNKEVRWGDTPHCLLFLDAHLFIYLFDSCKLAGQTPNTSTDVSDALLRTHHGPSRFRTAVSLTPHYSRWLLAVELDRESVSGSEATSRAVPGPPLLRPARLPTRQLEAPAGITAVLSHPRIVHPEGPLGPSYNSPEVGEKAPQTGDRVLSGPGCNLT